MFYGNAVPNSLNTNFNDLFNNPIQQAIASIPSPSSTSSSSANTNSSSSSSFTSSPTSSSPLKDSIREVKLPKLEFTNLNVQNNRNNNNNNTKAAMSSNYYQITETINNQSVKRKISNTDFDENIPIKTNNNNNGNSNSNTNTNNSHSNSNSFQIISSKPFKTQSINSKCVLNIYYKSDLLTAIDDHFTKSFNSNHGKSYKILQLGKSEKSDSHLNKQSLNNQSNNFKLQTNLQAVNNYWNTDSLKTNTNLTTAAAAAASSASTTPSYDVYTWPYYPHAHHHHSYNTNSTQATNHHTTNNTNTHVQDSLNRVAADMAASFYSNPHYASSLANIHHHHHHQYNSLLTNNIFTDTNSNVTNNTHHLYNQQTSTAVDLLSTLTNTNTIRGTNSNTNSTGCNNVDSRNDMNINSLLTQKYTKNVNNMQDGHQLATQSTSSSSTVTSTHLAAQLTNGFMHSNATLMSPTNSYNFTTPSTTSSSTVTNQNNTNQQTQQLQFQHELPQQTIDLYNHHANTIDLNSSKTTANSYSTSTPYACSNNDTNFIDYATSASTNPSTSAVVKVAAAVANQYISASLNAAAANSTNSTNATYQHRYHHHHHPQYLNHFDLTKTSIQDCRRATNAVNHYAHLSSHIPYPGFDLTAAAVDAAFKDSNSTASTYAAPLWY